MTEMKNEIAKSKSKFEREIQKLTRTAKSTKTSVQAIHIMLIEVTTTLASIMFSLVNRQNVIHKNEIEELEKRIHNLEKRL